jgi:serine/threonine-protein kinase
MTREGETSVTVTTTSLGTPLYMSPEQVRSAKGLDARTDIWSLAVIAYELLAGRTPFVGETPTAVVASIVVDEPPPLRDLRPDVPEEVAAAIHAALVKDPAKRTPDVQTFAEALVSFGPPGTFVAPAPAAPPLVTIRPPGAEGGASSVAATALSGPGSNAAATTPGWSTQRMQRQGAMAWAKLAGVAAGVVAIVAGVVALRARAHEIPQPSPAAASGSLATSATVIAPERPPESSAAPEPQPPPTTRTEEVPSGSSSSTPPALPRHPVTRPGTRPARSATVASPPSAVPPPPPAPTGTPPNHI